MLWECNYFCVFTAKAIENNKVVKTFDLHPRICFGEVLTYLRSRGLKTQTVEYKVYFNKDDYFKTNTNLMSLRETKKILKRLANICPFTFKLGVAEYQKGCFDERLGRHTVVKINMTGTYSEHLFVTTMLRVFFEYPYNIAAREAMDIIDKKIEYDGIELYKLDWLTLYFIVVVCLGGTVGHGITNIEYVIPIMNDEELSDAIKKTPTNYPLYAKLGSLKGGNSKQIIAPIPKNYHQLRNLELKMERCKYYVNLYKIKKKDEGICNRT